MDKNSDHGLSKLAGAGDAWTERQVGNQNNNYFFNKKQYLLFKY
jgi:hypothetical protein